MSYSESELIEGCRNQKARYQHALYNQYKSWLFGMCLRYSANRADAEDVLQEGFVKIYRNIAQYNNKGSFEGWMCRIMINTAININKKWMSKAVFDQDVHFEKEVDFNVVQQLSAKDLMRVVQELPTGYRTVFNLYVIDGYSHKEIGEMLGVSEGTSKSQLARGKKMLQEKVMKNEQARV